MFRCMSQQQQSWVEVFVAEFADPAGPPGPERSATPQSGSCATARRRTRKKRLIEALARTFGVQSAFFFDDYTELAGLLQEQVELLALVRDARISSAQLRAILELSPQARQAITDLVQATARDDTRRHGGHDEAG